MTSHIHEGARVMTCEKSWYFHMEFCGVGNILFNSSDVIFECPLGFSRVLKTLKLLFNSYFKKIIFIAKQKIIFKKVYNEVKSRKEVGILWPSFEDMT